MKLNCLLAAIQKFYAFNVATCHRGGWGVVMLDKAGFGVLHSKEMLFCYVFGR